MAKSIEDLSTKFLLTFEESAIYFGIGKNKLRNMANYSNTPPDWVVPLKRRNDLIKTVRALSLWQGSYWIKKG